MNDKNRRLISVIVLNEHGVLSRISGLFSGRGYNIDSLTVAPIPDTEFSRVSIVTSGDARVFEQITKQLHKLLPIYKVIEEGDFVEKELALVKIPLSVNLAGLDSVLKSYNGSVANSNSENLIIIACDDSTRITSFIKTMSKYSPVDIVRSGSVMLEM
ncbi:acetolactate synthase III, valine-sensitive, regulatory (small) subunit [Campylobacter blaseri]|uniref:Acetolactate synthase small subunit n=1 Tax=Campylobacter blaseri TaxID=2042961 RepID=A0A2P8R2Q0_9BACT|nr:acetolactate synthase small subunit [Campylobacter blaseri]PSM52759.1 acetolactate synthase small subunit [Campylobacter blaseri]PSM54407.1 acetolactate synthase small subunit [Campylobacter blaseri]QKF86069.1 acetolactate synthase III, valine-sensitive, regulatory (small) subunit [Campylobacter blaseri]